MMKKRAHAVFCTGPFEYDIFYCSVVVTILW
jgi:hypothetical protein